MSQLIKPTVQLSGENGNIFNLLSICTSALKKAKQAEQAKELTEKIFDCTSYEEALALIQNYVDVE